MTRIEIFKLIEREGLLGLYHQGLFNPQTCEYTGTALKDYWEHRGLPNLVEEVTGK